jgi:hypothetical protein
MSDDNDSGGIIGTIISILILIAIWPYLLAILGLYIAYLAVMAALEWITQNPQIVVFTLLAVFLICAIYRYRLIPKVWQWMMLQLRPSSVKRDLSQKEYAESLPNLEQRNFIPSTNLYCYWCTKKLGLQTYEHQGRYCCKDCLIKLESHYVRGMD